MSVSSEVVSGYRCVSDEVGCVVPCPSYALIDEAHGLSGFIGCPIEEILHVLNLLHLVLKVVLDYSACVPYYIHGSLMSIINRLNNHGLH